jgi:hypothetical protein
MSLDIISSVWDALSTHIDLNERKYAAETLIDFLIDNDFQPNEILEHFQGDTEMTHAIKGWVDQYGDDDFDFDDAEDTDTDDWD